MKVLLKGITYRVGELTTKGGLVMYQMTETEMKFAELIWKEEPVGSGDCERMV